MFKKSIAILGMTAMLFSFGCSSATTENSTDPQATTPTTQAPTTAPEADEAKKELTLVDNENCTVIVKGYDEKDILGYGVKVYLENKTDKELMFSVDQVSVNGFMCDPLWASTVAAGKKANEQITFFKSDLEENNITKVEEITFTLKVYDNNDWAAEHLVTETFTIKP